jgi:hypothetical protein
LIFKRATIQGVFSVPNLYFDEAIGILREHGDSLRRIIRRRIPATQLETWFHKWSKSEGFSGKTIVNFRDGECLLKN